jgi:poly-beta-hydroxybutyrate-responsive repressor
MYGCNQTDCRCAAARMEKFAQPCLLLLLRDHSAHGYELIRNLAQFGFAESDGDPGTIYRHLRRMEEEVLVTSHWETEGGPAKRTYSITPDGAEALHAWARTLERNKTRLEIFLARYREGLSEREDGAL